MPIKKARFFVRLRRTQNDMKGFTLIEILLVVIIIGILMVHWFSLLPAGKSAIIAFFGYCHGNDGRKYIFNYL